jgi:hypothetical protein
MGLFFRKGVPLPRSGVETFMLLPNRWANVDNRSVRSHQKIVDAVNTVYDTRVDGHSRKVTPNNTTFQADANLHVDYLDVRVVVIVKKGPADEADYTDERYWGQITEINAGDFDTAFAATKTDPAKDTSDPENEEPPDSEPKIITFTNVPEILAHSHFLQASDDQPVIIMKLIGPDGVGHWVSNLPTDGLFWGKVSAYTAGSNQVTLTPCDVDGTTLTDGDDEPLADQDVYITLPTTKAKCSFFMAATDDVLAYKIKDGVAWLDSVPMPYSTTKNDTYTIQAGAGTGGFNSVRVKA